MSPLSPEKILRNLEHGFFMSHQEQTEAALYIRQLQQAALDGPKVMQQAYDALDVACRKYGEVGNIYTDWGRWDAAMTSLREALSMTKPE